MNEMVVFKGRVIQLDSSQVAPAVAIVDLVLFALGTCVVGLKYTL